jgi:peptide/nickel transport system substrate-binding protein
MRSSRHPVARRARRLIAAVAVLALAACGDDDDDDGAGGSVPAATEAPSTDASAPLPAGTGGGGGEGGEIVVRAVLEPTSLDLVTVAGAAIDQVLLDNVYETLLTLGDDGQTIESGLAELPEISADRTVYTFTLQDGVTFHSGEALTSADVVWSLDAQRADGANEVARLGSISTVEAPDERTVVVTLTQPDNDFLYTMTSRGGAVLQAEATDLQNSANGTGPFTFEEWNVGSSITLARNDAYWGEAPAISGVTFLYIPDPNAGVNAFTTGDVDILTGVNTDLVGPLQDNPDYVVNVGTSNSEFTLGFNNAKEPFTDPAVRKAIRQAIDKDGYKELLNGFGTIIGGPVPPTDPWYEDLTDVAPYDTEAAAAALEAAGYGDGFDVTLVWPNFYPTSNAEYVASQLAEVGINVEIQPVEFSVWLDQVYTNHEYDMTAVLHAEPRDIGNYANPDYYWQYDNPEVQRLINDAKVSPDPTRRSSCSGKPPARSPRTRRSTG